MGLFSKYIKNVNMFLFGCDGFSRMSETYNVYIVERRSKFYARFRVVKFVTIQVELLMR